MKASSFTSHQSRQVPDQELGKMATVLGVSDQTILRQLRALGFNSQTARLLWLMPSLQVAWADGYVSLREGELLCRAACSRSAVSELSAKALFQQWLEQSPSETFFQQAMHSIHDILDTVPPLDRNLLKQDLLAHCDEIAAASRALRGLHRCHGSYENAVTQQIAAAI